MSLLTRKNKARISAAISPTLLLQSVLAVGALVVVAHMVVLVLTLMGLQQPWMKNTLLLGPLVAIVAFAIAIPRRLMAINGWGAVHAGAVRGLIEALDATSNSQLLQAALVQRIKSQGWLSWSCVIDTLSRQGLSDGQFKDLKSELLSAWGPVHNLHGPVANRACFRHHMHRAAWRHGLLAANTPQTQSIPALSTPIRF